MQVEEVLANIAHTVFCAVCGTGGKQQLEEVVGQQQKQSSCLLYSPAAATSIICETSTTQLLGPPLRIWDTVEMSSLETSLCGDETESSSSDGDSTPSSSEEEVSSGDECSLAARAKRAQWLVLDGGVGKIKGRK